MRRRPTLRTALAVLAATLVAGPGTAGAAPLVPDDPLFPHLWGLDNPVEGIDLRAPLAWGITTGSPDVLVAVLDTGIDPTHPDLAPNLRPDLSRNFVAGPDGSVDPLAWGDRNGHGTHVAATLAARGGDGLGVPGLAWRTGLVALRVCGDGAGAGLACQEDDLVAGIDAAGAMGARVANVSLAGDVGPSVRAAIEAHPGTLYVVASGNRVGGGIDLDLSSSGRHAMCRIPAANLICVGALDRAGAPADFGNLGRQSVDLLAPGVGILSAGLVMAAVPVGDPVIGAGWTATPAGAWSDVPSGPGPAVEAVGAPAEATLSRDAPLSFAGLRACRLQHRIAVTGVLDGRRLQVQTRVGDGAWVTAPSDVDPAPESTPGTRVADLSAAAGGAAVHLRDRVVGAGSRATAAAFRIAEPVVT
ncbi:MAG: S8 family serine peptidase, partial [Miltoncostaeaceae bacterium]